METSAAPARGLLQMASSPVPSPALHMVCVRNHTQTMCVCPALVPSALDLKEITKVLTRTRTQQQPGRVKGNDRDFFARFVGFRY